jgi:hypothetical protein
LKWSDVDWGKGTLLVQRQLQQVESKGYALVPPKTKAGKRQLKLGEGPPLWGTLPIPAQLMTVRS